MLSATHSRLIGGFLISAAILSAQTRNPNQSTIELDPFPVVGTRLPADQLPESPARVTIDRAEIERYGASDLTGVLQRLPQVYMGAGSGIATVPNGSPGYGNAQALFNFGTGGGPALKQTGVASTGLRGLGAGGTLVLIDGRRMPLAIQEDTASDTGAGFYNLSSIPLGLVERVEVLANGASAVHGSEAVGGVVNVVLRKNYTGSEVTAGFRATEAGGGMERHGSISTGLVRDKLSLFLSATARSAEALPATARTFSASSDQSTRGGRDHSLIIGSPAIVRAPFGTLNGVVDAGGAPARFGLVPTGQDGTDVAPADFEGRNGFFSTFLRYYDPAPFRDLTSQFEQLGLRAALQYEISDTMQAYANLTWSDRASETRNEPPAISGGGFGGADTRVFANHPLNPFGQDVQVSLVHVEAPPRPQTVAVDSIRATAGLHGNWGEDWQWDTAGTFSQENFHSRTLDLDTDAFIDVLADGSFNPFGDPETHGPINAGLYDRLMEAALIDGDSGVTAFDFSARGPVFDLPAGSALLAVGAETQRIERQRSSTNPRFGQPADITSSRTSTAAFAEVFAPLHASLSARAAARYESADAFEQTSPSLSLTWQPVSAISLHASYAEGFRAPALTEIEELQRTRIDDISDPQFNGASYDVEIVDGGNLDLIAEESQSYQFGLNLDIPGVSGLQLQVLSSETYFTNKISSIPQQTMVAHEADFPDRVTRGPGGRITQVDITAINFGKIYTHSLDYRLIYQREFAATGLWSFRVDAMQQREYRYENRPDRVGLLVEDGADTASPPEWAGFAQLFWRKGPWDFTVLANYMAGYESNDTGSFFDAFTSYPSFTTLDLRLGHTFKQGIWRDWGRDARLQVGVGNISDEAPPFANTPWGYNQNLHSPLGRTYDVSLRFPF